MWCPSASYQRLPINRVMQAFSWLANVVRASMSVIEINEPKVVVMRLPSIIMKGFVTVPTVTLANCDVDDCKFHWYRQISSKEKRDLLLSDKSLADKIDLKNHRSFLHISDGITYSPTDDDVAHFLRVDCFPSDGQKVGPIFSCVSGQSVELGPPYCPFQKRHLQAKDKCMPPNRLRLVSYNILADMYADSDYSRKVLFAHCPPHALQIGYRRQLLLKEINGYNADIICLQEVDKKEFKKTYEPYFKVISNHQGLFDSKGGLVGEGVATFFREDRFELIESHRTILSKVIDPCYQIEDDLTSHPILSRPNSSASKKLSAMVSNIKSAIFKNTELTKRFMNRHTILQTNLLRVKDNPQSYLIVANTHLYFAPDADHVRLLQGSVCVKYLEFIKDFYKTMLQENFNSDCPKLSIIFCGDMNSTPDCGLFKLAHEGRVGQELPDWRSNEEEAVEGLSVESSLRFSSAYKDLPYTNYTPDFNGWLDHIYYEVDTLECESTVPLPDHDDVLACEGIPSDVFPSDHLALIANFRLKS